MQKKSDSLPNYISPVGHQKLIDEHEQLTKVERAKVVKTISWAASNGDRSENADYIYGKKRLREIDRRLRFLSKRLDKAQVVRYGDKVPSVIQFGAKVVVSSDAGDETSYTILGEDEVAIELGHISWKSPIGKSLLGKEIGDIITVTTPKGKIELEVINFSYGVEML